MKLVGNLTLDRYQWAAACANEFVPVAPGRNVADIGAGKGMMRDAVLSAGGVWHGFDLDPDHEQIKRWDLDLEPQQEWERPGAILFLDVLEHLNNPWLALRHLSDFLLPQGILLLTTPNPRWSRSRMSALVTGYPACFTQEDLIRNHHVFTPWPHVVERLLDQSGLDVLRYVTLDGPTPWPGSPITAKYPLRFGLACLNKLIERCDPTACGMSYGIVARKRAG
jgi:hypothetical protein